MTAAIAIRPFVAADAATFRRLRLAALAAHPGAFGNSVADEEAVPMATVAERLARGDTFGAFDGGEPVAMAGFFQETGEKRRHRGLLWGVYVDPARRGLGLAGRLVDRVVQHAADRVEMLHLGVAVDNREARRVYEGRGFVAFGIEHRAFKLDDRYVDELLMVRFLSGPPAPIDALRAILQVP